jgi:hypothetical protein
MYTSFRSSLKFFCDIEFVVIYVKALHVFGLTDLPVDPRCRRTWPWAFQVGIEQQAGTGRTSCTLNRHPALGHPLRSALDWLPGYLIYK